MALRKLVRSLLIRFPRLYATISSQWRYRLLHRLGRVHEREFRALPLLVDRPDALVLDVGANNGQSILSIKAVLPQARIVSFEPGPSHEAALRSLERRLPDVTIEMCALADEEGELELTWPVYNGLPMDALASLDREQVMSWLGPTGLYGYDPDRLEFKTARVPTKRLDSLGLDPAVIKIDTQGTEANVIKGGLETIKRTRPAIMAEELHEGSDAHRLLEPLGYEVCTYLDGKLERGETGIVTNRFLVPRERLPG